MAWPVYGIPSPPTNQTPLLLCNSRICSPLWDWMLDPESNFAEATVLWSEDGGLVSGRPTETILKVKVCVWAEINWHWSHLYRHRPRHARWEGNLLLYYFIINCYRLNTGKIGKEKTRKSFILNKATDFWSIFSDTYFCISHKKHWIRSALKLCRVCTRSMQ